MSDPSLPVCLLKSNNYKEEKYYQELVKQWMLILPEMKNMNDIDIQIMKNMNDIDIQIIVIYVLKICPNTLRKK